MTTPTTTTDDDSDEFNTVADEKVSAREKAAQLEKALAKLAQRRPPGSLCLPDDVPLIVRQSLPDSPERLAWRAIADEWTKDSPEERARKAKLEAQKAELQRVSGKMGGQLHPIYRETLPRAVLNILDSMPAVYNLAEAYEKTSDDDNELQWRIRDIMERNQNVLVVGQWKTGKSALVDNMIRSLVDGEPFLDRFEVAPEWQDWEEYENGDYDPVWGDVLVLDTEMDTRFRQRGFAQQKLGRAQNVHVMSLKGRLDDFNLLDPLKFRAWSEYLQARDISTLVLDCLSPILVALDLGEKDDIGQFLQLWDELKIAAGVRSSIIVHHAGSEQIRDVRAVRSRGDTRLMGWADSIIKVHRTDNGSRYFHAECRGGDEVQPGLLVMDKETRQISLGAAVNNGAGASDEDVIRLRELVAEQSKPVSTRGALSLLSNAGVADLAARDVIARAEKVGAIKRISGPRNAKLIVVNHDW